MERPETESWLSSLIDTVLAPVPEEFRLIALIALGLLALGVVLKIIGAAIKVVLSIVILVAVAALFVFVTHDRGWIDWPFYDGETITLPDNLPI